MCDDAFDGRLRILGGSDARIQQHARQLGGCVAQCSRGQRVDVGRKRRDGLCRELCRSAGRGLLANEQQHLIAQLLERAANGLHLLRFPLQIAQRLRQGIGEDGAGELTGFGHGAQLAARATDAVSQSLHEARRRLADRVELFASKSAGGERLR